MISEALVLFMDLGPLNTKPGGGSREGILWGYELGGDLVLRGPDTFCKVIMCLICHG